MRNPNQIVAMTMDSGVAINQVEGTLVVLKTGAVNDTVTLPSGTQPTTPLFGLLYEQGPAVSGGTVQVVISGIWPGIAQGTMNAGDEATAYSTAGSVQSISGLAGGTNAGIIGTVLESATTGQRVAIDIGPYVKQG
jgi:hypothetical protein